MGKKSLKLVICMMPPLTYSLVDKKIAYIKAFNIYFLLFQNFSLLHELSDYSRISFVISTQNVEKAVTQ